MATLNVVGYTQRDNGSWVKVNGTLTYSVSSTDTSYTITLSSITSGTSSTSFTTYFKIVAGGTQIARVSFSSTGVKTINVSGTKTIQKTHATQTMALTMTNELAFKSNSSGSGQGPSATVNLSVPPKSSYTVLYNTQGGSSVSSQTKWHGEDLTLSTTVPTKNGYLFKNWTDGTNVYASGASYTANANLELTAVWYSLCVLEDYDVYRCRYADPSTPEDEGRSAFFTSTLRYDPDLLFSGGTYSSSMGMEATVRVTDSNNMTTVYTQNGIPSGGTTGSDGYKRVPFTTLLGSAADNSFSTDETFQVSIEIKTKPLSSTGYSNQTMTYIATIPVAFFTMDVLAGGHGIAFGGPSKEEAFVNYFKSKFLADVMFETMTGTIQMFGGTTPPNGWLICDGSAVSRATYSLLFDVIGTIWGDGDNSTTFNLPDLRGRAPIGAGTGTGLSARTLGVHSIGSENAIVPYHTHSIAHTHYLTSDKKQAWLAAAGTGATEPGGGISGSGKYYAAANATGYAWVDVTAGSNSSNAGYAGSNGNTTGANMQPSAVVNFIICTGVLN
jgi:microcystin-dependent protein